MIIDIAGLGVVKEAHLDLTKRLTVFTGVNNTGKTYVSYIVYGLTHRQQSMGYHLDSKDVKALMESREHIIHLDTQELCEYRNMMVRTLARDANEVFGISVEQGKKLFSDLKIDFATPDDLFMQRVMDESFSFGCSVYGVKLKVEKNAGTLDILVKYEPDSKIDMHDAMMFFSFGLKGLLYNTLVLYPLSQSVIFPVERNSIYTFSKELSINRNILVDQMQELRNHQVDPFDLLNKRTTRYPQPIRDGLETAEDMANNQKRESEFRQFADEIENSLLMGRVSVSDDGEVQFTASKTRGKKLPIHLSASVVKTLSSLVFYLRHLAHKNDLIIIDEPELNLHPDSQVCVARIFVRMINAGFRMLISTHSDYIVRELNNLIMLSADSPAMTRVREKYGYKDDERISPDQVGAYYFSFKTKSRSSVTVKPLHVGKYGFEVPSIDETIDRLNDTAEELFDAIKYPDDVDTE